MNLNFDRETIENIIIDEGGVMREPYFCTKGKLTWIHRGWQNYGQKDCIIL